MNLNAENVELNQISVTGTRAIVLLGLLMVAPRSMEEIRDALIKYGIMEKSHSNDILRIDLNTLKCMGCKISRASRKTNNKYILESHPFDLKFDIADLQTVKKVYSRMKSKYSISLLLDYDSLFRKLAKYVYDNETKEALLGISVIKNYDLTMINQLSEDCQNNRTVNLVYKKPTSGNSDEKEIVAQKLFCRSDKLYLCGYDINKKASVMLNVKRILKRLSGRKTEEEFENKNVTVRFYLSDFGHDTISSDEQIVETLEDGYIIEGSYFNEFIAVQRILSFGDKCIVKEPEDFKIKIIEKLKEIREVYGG